MARTEVTNADWTEIGTTATDELFGVEGGDVRIYTRATSGISHNEGHLLREGTPIIIPAGIAVSVIVARKVTAAVVAGNASVIVTNIPFAAEA